MTKPSLILDAAEPIALGADAPLIVTLKHYLQLTKPGIVFGNLVSVAGGFFMAARGHIDPFLFIATVTGVSLVVASGCVFNNYIDRDIDVKMERTQNRVLVQGLLSPVAALIFAIVLGALGIALLGFGANALSALLAVAGLTIYVGIYSLYLKRHSIFGTAFGSLSGAMPPVIGYCAVTGHFDLAAALLLLMFSLWQMPHSFAIAIVYLKDYTAAGIPVMPVKMGIAATRKRIAFYIPIFTLAAVMLSVFGYTGIFYFTVMAGFGLYWLYAALAYGRGIDDRAWARKMFTFSIIAVMLLSLMMSLDFHR